MSRLLSIVIPTKDRYKTLFPVISNIISSIDMTDCEIVISDNTANNEEALSFLDKVSQRDRIIYDHVVNSISMVDNAENALSLADGEYLLFIGDDDFVSPFVIQVVKDMKERDYESLTYPIANYFYENVQFRKKYAFNKPATLQVTKNNILSYQQRDSEEELDKVCQIGGIYISGLPRLYHGIVKRNKLELIKKIYGKYIPGPCPDMTLSVALSLIIKKYYYVEYPVSISGASSASEGGKGPMNKHVEKLEDKKWLNQEDIRDWDERLPRIFSRETIWGQCLVHVLKIANIEKKINYQKLYSSMIINCPNNALPYVIVLYKSLIKSNKLMMIQYCKDFMVRYFKNIIFSCPAIFLEILVRVRGDYKKFNCVHNLTSIDEVCKYLKANYLL